MVDTVVFELDISTFPAEIRNNIIRHWLNKESYNVVKSKAFFHRNLEYDFTRKHLQFSVNYPSSHYVIHCDLDDLTKKIKFNLSIPKLLYGCNLFLCDYHYYFQDAIQYDQRLTTQRIEHNFEIMINTIFEVCNMLSTEEIPLPILLESLSFFRFDYCKNYLFPSKEHCFQYIENLKSVKLPYGSTSHRRTFDTALMYVFGDYSLKVYHKGSEMKEDLTLLENIFNPAEISQILEIADCTLRYEVTFRIQKIRDLFLRTFRDKCQIFQIVEEEIKQKFAQRKVKISGKRSEYYRHTPEEEFNAMYTYGKPRKNFYPEPFFNPLMDLTTFCECCLFADDKINKFQADKRISLIEASKRIDESNDLRLWHGEKPFKKAPIMKILNLLEHKCLDELENEGIISRASKYNYLKKFNALGINIKGGTKYENYVTNNDIGGDMFCDRIALFADRLLSITQKSKKHYLNGIR